MEEFEHRLEEIENVVFDGKVPSTKAAFKDMLQQEQR